MKTILLLWNPKKWNWDDLQANADTVNKGKRFERRWSCGVTRKIEPGDRVFLMRLGLPPKGIMGSGEVISKPKESSHWDKELEAQGKTAYYINVLFDTLFQKPIINEEMLLEYPFSSFNWFPQASARFINKDIARELEIKWKKLN